ncbi:lysosomal aspartic protease [Clonorchis sinensis]|uniref:Lysosomal aspartic protease n=1 Tax=Clonorchis sinensis TaxID=79923 RepID=G7YS21_CLOSI|nr:lysosomal aspartic protease [Clonorchis sinensis]
MRWPGAARSVVWKHHKREIQLGSRIPLWRSCGRHYCGPLSFGTPTQQFKMLFDTGSCGTWVRSVNSETEFTDQAYDCDSSESAEVEGNQQTMEYAKCRITGIVVKDSVTLGNKNINIRFANGVELSQSCPPRMSFDGIVGLCAVPGKSTFLNQLFEEDIINERIFSIWINPNRQDPLAGSLILGGVHDGLYSGTLDKVSLEPLRNWWCFRLTGIPLWRSCGRHYCGPLSFGTPTQQFKMLFDTGSCSTWVRSVNSETEFTDQAYDCDSSESAEVEENQQTMEYAKCRITGIVVKDSVTLGNKNINIRFANGVELSQSCPPRMSFDGIVGLCAVPGKSTFLNQLFEEDIINERIFSIWINPNRQDPLAGSLILGGVHDGLYSGTLDKVSLEPLRNWWCFRLTGHYCGPLSFGTPTQQFKMLFDTGSCSTWVRSVNSETEFTDQAYDCDISESAEVEENQQTMEYAKCRITGIVVKDSVTLGNKNINIRFANGVELSQSCPPRMSFDGIVGLCAVPGKSTFLNQLFEEDIINERIFSIWVNPNRQDPLAGSLILGGVHDGLYSGTLDKVSLEPLRNWWCFRLTGVRIDDGQAITLPYLVAVDSGATKLWVPESLLERINQVLHPIGFDGRFHLIDCSKIPKKPIIHLEVGEVTLSMEPKYYIRWIGGQTLRDFSFAEVLTQASSRELTMKFDGVVGICASPQTERGEATFLQQLFTANRIEERRFSIWTNPIRFADGETISASYLTAVDSGSPKIWVPESVLEQINRALQPVGFDGDYYSVECSRQSHYPIIYFETGLLVLSLEPRYYIRKV